MELCPMHQQNLGSLEKILDTCF
ncbi:hypothetical protein ACHAW6_002951 [Cyclotella cf. meneghiniana]